MTNLSTIKQWFRNGLKPTQEQFWAWMDSFWHKNEKIPQTSIDGLDKSLEAKAETSAVDTKANKDATGLDDDNIIAWKEALGVGELPSNIATVDEGEKVGNTHTKEQMVELLGKKLDTPLGEGTTNDYPYVVGVNEENESVKLPAGDLGKNVANSKPTSVAGAGLNMGAIWDIDTNGFPLRIKGLPDKSADTTFSRIMVQNAYGQNAWSNGSNMLISAMTAMSDAQKDSYRIASRKTGENYSTGQPVVSLITPINIIKDVGLKTIIEVFGQSLFINNVDKIASVDVIDLDSMQIVEHITTIHVHQTVPSKMAFEITNNLYQSGKRYTIQATHNGLKSIINPNVYFNVYESSSFVTENIDYAFDWELLNYSDLTQGSENENGEFTFIKPNVNDFDVDIHRRADDERNGGFFYLASNQIDLNDAIHSYVFDFELFVDSVYAVRDDFNINIITETLYNDIKNSKNNSKITAGLLADSNTGINSDIHQTAMKFPNSNTAITGSTDKGLIIYFKTLLTDKKN